MLPFYGRSGIPLDKEILFAGENVSPEYRRLVHALWYEPFTE